MTFERFATFRLAVAPDAERSAGALIGGRYRLERLLGEGGMGAVWQARNVLLDLPVALKLLHPTVCGDDATARLFTEARVEARLSHPSIVRVFDYGETERGEGYIVMELLAGSTLAALLDTYGPLPANVAVGLLLPIVHAICAVHRAEIVHRDLKPENIVIAETGSYVRPKLLDFGIAKLRGEFCSRLTVDGSLLGSPAYMAPEQARGCGDVDVRADVWALCVVLYELIAGANPFDADNPYAVLRAVIERKPAALTSAGCASLWPILRRGLAKDRRLRIASACELGEALARWLIAQGETEDVCGEPLARTWELRDDAAQRLVAAEPRTHAEQMLGVGWQGGFATPKSPSTAGAARRLLLAVCLFALAPALAPLLASGRAEPEKAEGKPAATLQRSAAPTTARRTELAARTMAETAFETANADVSYQPERSLPWTPSRPTPSVTATVPKPRAASSTTAAAPRAERPLFSEAALGLKDPFR
jgi:eukaryotic-like serine/threonine-protein kinase